MGSGRQYWPWIHRLDWIDLIRFVLATPAAVGAVNATAPHPVTNAQFAQALGRALHRPAIFPLPAAAVKAAFGQMGEEMLLGGQRVAPTRLDAAGFTFGQPDIDSGLASALAG